MPILATCGSNCNDTSIYKGRRRAIPGKPNLWEFVRPLVRQSGLGQDAPKGFQMPVCYVEPCCGEEVIPPGPGPDDVQPT